MWLAATSEQCGKNGGQDGGIRLNRSARKEENFTASQAARYELERCRGGETRGVTLCLTDIVSQREARFNEVIPRERRLTLDSR